ncbi:MAG TPA: SLC13 family permease [Kofleriaceae bacterium]|nr:SLC13 family permease [Kofleriaceae bacterium]
MYAAVAIFVVTYVVIAVPGLVRLELDRPAAALIGAAAMVVVGGLGLDAALDAVDLHVLVLLIGVLVIAAYLREARFFRWAAYQVLTRARSARSLLVGTALVAAALSALLVNDTVCLMMTPLVVAVAVEARLPLLPYLLALATSSNLGGVVTFSGNPQNMLVGEAAAGHPGFAAYLLLTLPAGLACIAANTAVLLWLFRRELPPGPLVERTPPRPAIDRRLAGKALAALAAFAVMAVAGVELAGAAITAAAALMLIARVPPRRALTAVDWPLLVFFAGLFVVVAGLRATGVIADVFRWLSPVIARGDLAGDLAFIALVVVGSNLVSNVPLAVIAVSWVPSMPDPAWGYVMLAVASTLAGNLTILGSVANVIVLEGAGPRGEIGFFRFLRYGAVLTAVSLAVAFGILHVERALGLAAWLGA